MQTKNSTELESFVAYCKANPDQRFWQALTNWSEYSFIFGSKTSNIEPVLDIIAINRVDLQDLFYKED